MAFDMETFDMSSLRALHDANATEQLVQTWSKDKNYQDLCFDLEYEAEAAGPGYIWIGCSVERQSVWRVRGDVELGVLLKHIFDTRRPARPFKAGRIQDCFWGGLMANQDYRMEGIPFLKMRFCDLARARSAFQVMVDI
jgi:hypothetical protein